MQVAFSVINRVLPQSVAYEESFLPDVCCRKGLILARKKEFSVFQLMFLFISQIRFICGFRLFFNFFCRKSEGGLELTLLLKAAAGDNLILKPFRKPTCT